MNGQAWNRYSYVINNPLALTDTNGYCFLGMCSWGKAISTFFNRTIGAVFRAVPILGSLLEIAASALCVATPVCAPFAAVVAGLTTSFVAGVTSGSLSYALRAGLIAGATAFAMYEVGNLTDAINGSPIGSHTPPAFGSDAYAFNVAGHALVGCASAVASGGKCGPAALAGAVTSVAAPFLKGVGFTAGLVANTVLGGLASVAGGGKFANGAITGAFGYLFNAKGGSGPGMGHNGPPEPLGPLDPLEILSGLLGLVSLPVAVAGAAINTVLTTSTGDLPLPEGPLATTHGGPVYVIGKMPDLLAAAPADLPLGATYFAPLSQWGTTAANIENKIWLLEGLTNQVPLYMLTEPIPGATLTNMFAWEYNTATTAFNYWRSGNFLYPPSLK
jgi:hypothetical protein